MEQKRTLQLVPILFSGGCKSISDDDLCATCKDCEYSPGGLSKCKNDWPGLEDDCGYVRKCGSFDRIKHPEENWTSIQLFAPCECCGHYHLLDFDGDCRDESSRFTGDQLDEKFGAGGWQEYL